MSQKVQSPAGRHPFGQVANEALLDMLRDCKADADRCLALGAGSPEVASILEAMSRNIARVLRKRGAT